MDAGEEKSLVAFAHELIRLSWDGCDDGDVIQEAAEKHGLIKRVSFDPTIHADDTGYAEPGDTWFVFAGPLDGDAS